MGKLLFSDWTIFRGIKLLLGSGLLYYAYASGEIIPGLFGGIALIAAIFNLKSPCEQGDESCALPSQSSDETGQ